MDIRIAALACVTLLALGAITAVTVNPASSEVIVDLISKIIVVVPTLIVVQQVTTLEKNMNSKMDRWLEETRASGKAEGIKEEQDKAEEHEHTATETNGGIQ